MNKARQHKEHCKYKNNFYAEILISKSPNLLWFDIQDVGSYQGSVYGIALYNKQIAIYEDSYGSCSGCGAWEESGNGGEPKDEADVIKHCTLHKTINEAMIYLIKMNKYENPDMDKILNALDELCKFARIK